MEFLQNCDQLCQLQEGRNALCRENEQLASKNYDVSVANEEIYVARLFQKLCSMSVV